jgi:hypothetical protein
LDGTVDIFVAVKSREHNYPGIPAFSPDLLDYSDAIKLGHSQIEQGDIRTVFFPEIYSFASVTGFSDNGHVGSTAN